MKQSLETIRQLYPSLSEKQLQAAEENLTAYLAVMFRIYQRLEQDETAMKEFRALTEQNSFPTIGAKVDSKQP